MKCNKCGKENIAGSKFCCECGSKLERLCPQCQSPVTATAKFCSECGANLVCNTTTSAIMKDNVIAGDVNQTVNTIITNNTDNSVHASVVNVYQGEQEELYCHECGEPIAPENKRAAKCSGCGQYFCEKHLRNGVCAMCKFEEKLSRFEFIRQGNQKYTITKLKNPRETQVFIPAIVDSIGDEAFMGSLVEEVILPEGLMRIGNRAFAGCKKLTTINFPNTLFEIGAHAFLNCELLCETPPAVAVMGREAFVGTQYDSIWNSANFVFETNMILGSPTTVLKSVFGIKNGHILVPQADRQGNPVTSIATNAFKGCSEVRSIVIPGSIKRIGNYAFEGCSNLSAVEMQPGVTHIGAKAFYDCTCLTTVTIPNSVARIEMKAFDAQYRREIRINYGGTKGNWRRLVGDQPWQIFSGRMTVYCSDGVI